MAGAAEQSAAGNTAAGAGKLPLLLALTNTVVVLVALGLLAYTRLVFKRPPITEDSERARLAELQAKPKPAAQPGTVTFDPITVNIAATPGQPKPMDGTAQQIGGKLHYVNLGFVLEIRDVNRRLDVERLRPIILDRLLSMLGRKAFHELTTVQGRYVLRTQILDTINQLLAEEDRAAGESDGVRTPLVSGIYFTQFLVQ